MRTSSSKLSLDRGAFDELYLSKRPLSRRQLQRKSTRLPTTWIRRKAAAAMLLLLSSSPPPPMRTRLENLSSTDSNQIARQSCGTQAKLNYLFRERARMHSRLERRNLCPYRSLAGPMRRRSQQQQRQRIATFATRLRDPMQICRARDRDLSFAYIESQFGRHRARSQVYTKLCIAEQRRAEPRSRATSSGFVRFASFGAPIVWICYAN